MISHSDTVGKLAEALARAQARIVGAKKDAENPFFHSRYADLSSIWDACREAITAEGLSVVQSPSTEFQGEPEVYTYISKKGEERSGVRVATKVNVTTRLQHQSGEWVEGTTSAMLPAADPQVVGSAITYLRRYALAAMVGVAPEDDDGEATARPVPRREPEPRRVTELDPTRLPGGPDAWGGHGGQLIADITNAKVLAGARKWLAGKNEDGHATKLIASLNARIQALETPEPEADEPEPPILSPADRLVGMQVEECRKYVLAHAKRHGMIDYPRIVARATGGMVLGEIASLEDFAKVLEEIEAEAATREGVSA